MKKNVLISFVTEAETELEAVFALNKILFQLLGDFCGKTAEQVEQDATRDFWLTAEEAVEYGIIDEVVVPKKRG